MRLRPSLEDLRVDFGIFTEIAGLPPAEAFAYMQIVRFDATSRVWTYSQPREDGGIDLALAGHHLMGCASGKSWRRVLAALLKKGMVQVHDGRIYPMRRFVSVYRGGLGVERPPIPASVRSLVMQRDRFRCVYCGDTEGPFDLDHVVPYSRGGSHTDPENLVCACVPCNRAKRAMTPEEWISGEAPR